MLNARLTLSKEADRMQELQASIEQVDREVREVNSQFLGETTELVHNFETAESNFRHQKKMYEEVLQQKSQIDAKLDAFKKRF